MMHDDSHGPRTSMPSLAGGWWDPSCNLISVSVLSPQSPFRKICTLEYVVLQHA